MLQSDNTRATDNGRGKPARHGQNEQELAINRKNALFAGHDAGHDAGAQNWAVIASLIDTAKLSGVDPQAWLADTLARIPDHKINRVDNLLPWKATS